eukprot:TRINITY_DN38398_c0_g1_i1.p1 TRINITY_DN38398_c0_g1~~TRINITY_DN38398_c0_g1_i1.p1  ORF type:complete len:541 (+),score=94.04 TRINITY_DN38398_c0_g1_i1:110-1732(+)
MSLIALRKCGGLSRSFRVFSKQLVPPHSLARAFIQCPCPAWTSRRMTGISAQGKTDGLTLVEPGDYDWDLFTIGIGSGGTRASRIAAQLGAKVAAVELSYHPISSDKKGGIGGTCVLRGCVPKKILMYGSTFSGEFADANGFGWEVPGAPTFNWKHLIEQKTKEIERLNGVYKKMLHGANVTMFEGRGRLVDAHTVEVESDDGEVKKYTSKYIVIATGGRAQKLKIPGAEHGFTSDEALSLDEQPKSIIIFGGGYIAVEFAGIFRGMGSEVHLLYRQPTPLRGFDDEMRNIVANNLSSRGVILHPNTNPTEIEKVGENQYVVHTDKGDKISVDAVMFATGRKSNTQSLNLAAAGVEVDDGGNVKVNEWSQSNVPSIFAVGDVTNRINLTPVALMEGQCVSKTLFGGEPMRPDHQNVASAVFCQPPLSTVGLNEQEAVDSATNDVLVFTSSFTPMKNIISGRKEKAFMKLLVDSGTDKVLGFGMVGPDSAEIMQGLAVAMKCGVTKKQLDATVGIHPTAAEEFVTLRTPSRRLPPSGKAKA